MLSQTASAWIVLTALLIVAAYFYVDSITKKPTPTGTPMPTSTPTGTPMPTSTPTGTPKGTEPATSYTWAWILGIVVVALVLAFLVYRLVTAKAGRFSESAFGLKNVSADEKELLRQIDFQRKMAIKRVNREFDEDKKQLIQKVRDTDPRDTADPRVRALSLEE